MSRRSSDAARLWEQAAPGRRWSRAGARAGRSLSLSVEGAASLSLLTRLSGALEHALARAVGDELEWAGTRSASTLKYRMRCDPSELARAERGKGAAGTKQERGAEKNEALREACSCSCLLLLLLLRLLCLCV